MIINSKFGLARRGTILKYNNDGTVLVGLDEINLQTTPQKFNVPMPLAWAGPNGEFIGGAPTKGSSVIMSQSQGGQWFIESYIPSRTIFTTDNKMANLQPGRALIQSSGGNRLFVDPKEGIVAGDNNTSLQLDPIRDIYSHNFHTGMSFTEGTRRIEGPIKRDLRENSLRNVFGTLDSHIYDDSLFEVSLDPTVITSIANKGDRVRNPTLVEDREVVYEFANSFSFTTDVEEAGRYLDETSFVPKINNGRRDSRADTFSLSLTYPNHLIESIKGTSVDAFGNVLDLNRTPIPLGKIDSLSLRRNPSKNDAFARLRAEHRKGLAFHWEMNARKQMDIIPIVEGQTYPPSPVPDTDDKTNYSRNRSRFFFDLDKEGQFKLNVPASSETGNIPLLTRYENFSVLLAKQDGVSDPNQFVKTTTLQEIFLDSFAGKPAIQLTGSDTLLDGYNSPIDRVTDQPILLGTAFHDITKVCNSFLTANKDILSPLVIFDPNHYLNQVKPDGYFVTNPIIVSGPQANAGGRSGTLSFDGFLNMSIGANTVDRQSLWIDMAGGVVSTIGRDSKGLSLASQYDGDVKVEIGGPGIGNEFDTRFATQNDAERLAVLDIRVHSEQGMLTVIRVDSQGVSIVTPGHLDLCCAGDMSLKSKSTLNINAERVIFFSESAGLSREIERRSGNI